MISEFEQILAEAQGKDANATEESSAVSQSEETPAEMGKRTESKETPAVWWDRFVPESFQGDAERVRRARLQARFGILGAVFGTVYAAFYCAVGHYIGSLIIAVCSIVIGLLPWILKKFQRLSLTGHLFAAILLAGFTALCLVEGGMKGHAIAWLASIPLCVLLLIRGMRGAVIWTVICSVVAALFGIGHMMGIEFPKTYPVAWGPAIDAAGYAGLVPFMAILGVIFEVTRRGAFEQLQETLDELSAANEHLTQLNIDKNEFLSIAAHDLKNPLGIISGYAGLLRSTATSVEPFQVVEQADQIADSADRMLDIISNLLDVRAIEDGSLKLKTEPCPIEPLVERVLRDYSSQAAAKNITVEATGELAGMTARSDCGVTHQILDNLVSNAIKYSPPGSRVELFLKTDASGEVAIEVIDEGPGLSESDQAKLFQKFSRLTPKPTGGESSNGLGLWIVHRMARAMGGDISCRSQLGQGSVFSLRLPHWEGAAVFGDPTDGLALPS